MMSTGISHDDLPTFISDSAQVSSLIIQEMRPDSYATEIIIYFFPCIIIWPCCLTIC